MMTDNQSRPKCRFWDKCYRKDANHQKDFLHPADKTAAGDMNDPDDDVTQIPKCPDLLNKKIVFYGSLKTAERKTLEEEADCYGCVPSGIISHKTDAVIIPDKSTKCADANRLGLEIYTLKQWKLILSSAKKIKTPSKKNDEPPKPVLKRKRSQGLHPVSDSDTDTEISDAPPALKKKLSRKKSVNAATPSTSNKEPEKPTLKRVNTRGKKQKCMYWDKCYRKDGDHREMYAHPGDPENSYDDEKDDRGKKTAKPKVYRPKHKANLQVLLAHKWTESVDPKGWWLSEKLDGVRAYWDGKTFYSRLGNEFIAPSWFIKGLPADMHLDGELFGGRGKFQTTVSIVKTPEDDRWKQLTYQVFDAPSIGHQTFEKRHAAIKEHFEKNDAKYVRVVDEEKCRDNDHLQSELKRIEALGGEGVMLRQPGSQYERRRSKTLLKLKTFHDAEARVIGYEPSKTSARLVGALRCVMACGKEFKVGSGLCDQDRRHPPKKGSIITYRFQEYTNSGSPRFPTFVGVRIDADEPSDVVLPKKGD